MVNEWSVIISPDAVKRLSKVPNPDRHRLLTAIDALHSGPSGDIKPLTGRPEHRLRVGKWRVILLLDQTEQTITILSVGPRGDIYKT